MVLDSFAGPRSAGCSLNMGRACASLPRTKNKHTLVFSVYINGLMEGVFYTEVQAQLLYVLFVLCLCFEF